MSLICAVAHGGAQMIATDMRHNNVTGRGRQLAYSDHGGKLVRAAPSTWVTFGGHWAGIAPVLERAQATRSYDDAWEVLKSASASLPRAPYTSFFISGPKGVGRVDHNRVREPSQDVLYIGHPPDRDNQAIMAEIKGLFAAFERETICTAGDLVRGVARLFARVAELSPFVSPTMEAVIDTRYIAGPAESLATMADAALVRRDVDTTRAPLMETPRG